MTFFARHIPGLATVTALILCSLLIVTGHNQALQRALNRVPTYTPQILEPVTAYFQRAGTQTIALPLSKQLAPGQPIRRLSYILLFAFVSPQQKASAYLFHADFGPVKGIDQASLYYFGLPATKLTTGEMLLLCDLAQGAKPPLHDPISAIKRRDTLLTELLDLGYLTPRAYQNECNRALSLSADHRPVN